ncbi:hypothetical protein FA15DRAFT_761178 [Coprinopsis marcescibilis]|uniref:Ubiquitin-like protease family profile domain-containing protein n=1 Tax=Coprinopsis marcescibilis TaxID=230819 RepID=A0A5C3KBX8_COPMA|nr:hypothetical protein FA15DRAFT_761178 [Coprinopsis marcescibilis]
MPPGQARSRKYKTRDLQPVTRDNMGLAWSTPVKRKRRKHDGGSVDTLGFYLQEKKQRIMADFEALVKRIQGEGDTSTTMEDGLEPSTMPDHEKDGPPDGDCSSCDGAASMETDKTQDSVSLTKTKRPKLSTAQKRNLDPSIRRLESSGCGAEACQQRKQNMKLMLPDRYEDCVVAYCDCTPLAAVLVLQGLFPVAPLKPRYAFDCDLLALFGELFTTACVADTAFAYALHRYYHRVGYYMKTKKGDKLLLDPFRKSFGHAKQWFELMLFTIDTEAERALEKVDNAPIPQPSERDAGDSGPTTTATESGPVTSATSTTTSETTGHSNPEQDEALKLNPASQHPNHSRKNSSKTAKPAEPAVHLYDTTTNNLGECARILRSRCPACFGGKNLGRKLTEGLDIHVAVDGNFAHRHLRSCGDCPKFFDPRFFLSKSEVDRAGNHIDAVRRKPAKSRKPKLPDEAVDTCEQSHQAGNGTNVKTSMEHFDDGGLAALVCRHDIPLFFANIDTPGEQQKYAIALLVRLFSLIPRNATVGVLYDVGCVLDRSLQLYDILPEDIMRRVVWATSAMHAYAHQWSCQLVYNPRFITGFGLTDGEGVERLWSRLRKLIGICRGSLRGKRIWIIDRQASTIADELKVDLGAWIRRRLGTKLEEHLQESRKAFETCEMQICELREQWRLQKEAQLSVRAHAPVRLRKELDALLRLQTDVEKLEKSLEHARAEFSDTTSADSIKNVEFMEESYDKMRDHVESLYASLNIQDIFPELKNLELKFVRQLLLLRDLKINIRKRAIGNLFEWDRLNQATGGRHQALGTKIHQQIRHTISKRTPALETAVKRFNRYCAELASMYQPEWNIPLPEPLPAKLGDLRNDPGLLEDVWISPSDVEIPPWLNDCSVREGIRGMLRQDRCLEEQRRLGMEADNLCRFFGRELKALDCAIADPENILLGHVLRRRREAHLYLQTHWATSLASQARFASHVASSTLGSSPPFGLTWTLPSTPESCAKMPGEDEVPDDTGYREQAGADDLFLEYVLDEPSDTDTSPPARPDYMVGEICWSPVTQLSCDPVLVKYLQSRVNTPVPLSPPSIARVIHHRGTNKVAFQLGEAELGRLSSNSWLNDECINGLATSFLHSSPFPNHFALFSSHDTLMLQYDASDAEVWRRTKRTEYWSRSVWIFPIHRPSQHHWVLVVAYPTQNHMLLFDSLGSDQVQWELDAHTVVDFVRRLNRCASARALGTSDMLERKWIASPVVRCALQTNRFDCGVWVIAFIASILRGYHLPDLKEKDIQEFRRLLYEYALCLPTMS